MSIHILCTICRYVSFTKWIDIETWIWVDIATYTSNQYKSYVSVSIHILCTICRYILDTSRAHQPACTQDVRAGTAFLHVITLSCWLIAVLQQAMREVSISHATQAVSQPTPERDCVEIVFSSRKAHFVVHKRDALVRGPVHKRDALVPRSVLGFNLKQMTRPLGEQSDNQKPIVSIWERWGVFHWP